MKAALFGLSALITFSPSAYAATEYDGEWPPYSSAQCLRAKVSGELDKRGMNDTDCNKLIINEGRPTAAKAATQGGFYLYDFGLWDVDSAGGVEPHAWIVNPNPTDAIKYVNMTLRMFNAVGDPVRSSIGNQSTFAIQFTGPLTNEDGPKHANWGPVGYNHSASCLQVETVSIVFMSGKKASFSGKRITQAFHPGTRPRCRP